MSFSRSLLVSPAGSSLLCCRTTRKESLRPFHLSSWSFTLSSSFWPLLFFPGRIPQLGLLAHSFSYQLLLPLCYSAHLLSFFFPFIFRTAYASFICDLMLCQPVTLILALVIFCFLYLLHPCLEHPTFTCHTPLLFSCSTSAPKNLFCCASPLLLFGTVGSSTSLISLTSIFAGFV